VSECDHESSIMRMPWHTGGCRVMVKNMAFMQGIYNYIPETNHVSEVHSVAVAVVISYSLCYM